MPKKCDHLETQSVTTAEPSAATPDQDAFAPLASDSFSKPTPEQEPALWMELRSLLDTLVGRAATPTDREVADGLVRRLGPDAAVNPLFLRAVRVERTLQAAVAAGVGQEVEVERLRREISFLGGLSAGDPATNRANAEERERLAAEYLTASRLCDAAKRAASQLFHVRTWLWPLFSDVNPCPETTDFMGQTRRKAGGILGGCQVAPEIQEVASEMGIDPYVWDSWRNIRRAEPAGPRRRYRSTSLSSPSPVSSLGQSPYPSRF